MGSFDMACAVSGLSLGGGQPVKMFFIVPNPYKEFDAMMCYSSDMYKLCSFGIDMEYDDYGQYSFDDTQETFIEFKRFIDEKAVYVEQGENQYHEKEFDPKNPEHMETEYLMEQIYKGRVRIKMACSIGGQGEYKELCVNYYPIHKRVFDECMLKSFDTWRGEVTFENCADRLKEQAMARNGVWEILKEHCMERYEDGSISKEEFDEKMEEIEQRMGGMVFSATSINMNEYFYGQYGVNSAYQAFGDEQFWFYFREVYMMWMWTMNLNKMIAPVMGAGQEYFLDEKIAFYDGVKTIAEDIKREWEEDD